uniref:Phospholipase B-like n=1 Tax=Pseudococcomyxa simplex TaxID=464287 RepID=A0A7L9QE10_9CHLO|nr:putative extracellular protein CSOL_028 [Pseudococcomyxa simplex]
MLLATKPILLSIGSVVLAHFCAAAAGHITHIAVVQSHGTFQIVSDTEHPGALATASYLDSLHTSSGWGQLSISTKAGSPDALQLYAAGFLEGYLTAHRISDHHANMEAFFNISSSGPSDFLLAQDAWAQEQVATGSTPFWTTLGLILQQHDGLMDGYSLAANDSQNTASGTPPLPQLNRIDFLKLSAVGDLGDLVPALEPKKQVQWETLDARDVEETLASQGHCSALVKVTGNYSDLFLAHSSWFTYSGMVRIYKHYDFAVASPHHKLRRTSFSSYPGELSSDDDFYLMDTGLALLQTTNDILDTELYKLLTPKSVLNWQRVRLANAMADTGKEWADVVSQYNSGTYNNQYMIVDLKLFGPGQELQPNLLWVVEQIPGLTVAEDQTEILSRGYWPSYNVPFYPEIYRRSGYLKFQKEQEARGRDFVAAAKQKSYQLAPRATIFRRDAGEVTDLASLKRLMRSNDYQNDPYSDGKALNAICGRGDLDGAKPRAYGCYDSKVANFDMAQKLAAEGIVGPAGREAGLEPFEWKEGSFAQVAHHGQPRVFDFKYEPLSAELLSAAGALQSPLHGALQ